MEPECRPIPMQLTCPRIKNPLASAQQRPFFCFSVQGEHEDILTRLKKALQKPMPATQKRKYEAGTSKGKERIEGEGEDDVAAQYLGELGDEFTRLMSPEYLYNLAYPELQAMSTEYSYNFAWNSSTQKRKYEAGTSKGRELIEGEGEDDVPAQYIVDALGSVFKERLKDNDLLFSLSSQAPNFALSQRAEECEHNFARERAEEREHNFALPRRAEEREHKFGWVEGLGSVVSRAIKFGKFAAPFIGIYLLNKNTGKKFDDFALQIKAANEARVGTTGRASPVSFNLNISMINANISASPRLGFLNREKRGNDVEVTGSK